jgi:hypothetical protein
MDLSERGTSTARHPWEIERFRAYRSVLAEHGALDACRVLDVGAGDGWFSESLLHDLPNVEQVVCWDVNYNELDLGSDDPRLVRSAERPSPGFDLVLVLDVLEHIEDPATFLDQELRPLTSPGTPALVAVPAHPSLFGDHDRALGHHRRYRADELLAEVSPWITVIDHGPLFPSLVVPRAASIAVERLRARFGEQRQPPPPGSHGVGEWHGGPATTKLLCAALAADTRATRHLGRFRQRLTGLSHWAYGLTT